MAWAYFGLTFLACAALAPNAAAKPAATPSYPVAKLSLKVTPNTPDRWLVRVTNDDTQPLRLVEDARLLWFEVTPSPDAAATEKGKGKRAPKKVTCTLGAARPSSDADNAVILKPGGTFDATIDPRFFCFGASALASIGAGASIVAHYGWEGPKNARVKAAAPFVASSIDLVTPDPAIPTLDPRKEAVADPFTVPANAAPSTPPANTTPPESAWPAPRSPSEPTPEPPTPLKVTATPFEDAAKKEDVAVTVTVQNLGRRAATLLFRPGTIGFHVDGPYNSFDCVPPGAATNIPELYTTLGPKAKESQSLGLASDCPAWGFSRTGVYVVRPWLDTRRSAGMLGRHPVAAERAYGDPMLVRVREGTGDGRLPDVP